MVGGDEVLSAISDALEGKRERPMDLTYVMNVPRTINQVFEAVNWFFGVNKRNIRARNRQRHVVRARKVTVWMLAQTGITVRVIGRAVRRTSATVIYARDEMELEVRTDPEATKMLLAVIRQWKRYHLKWARRQRPS